MDQRDQELLDKQLRRFRPAHPMSALVISWTSRHARVMSALPPKADMAGTSRHVRYVPGTDIGKLSAMALVSLLSLPELLTINGH